MHRPRINMQNLRKGHSSEKFSPSFLPNLTLLKNNVIVRRYLDIYAFKYAFIHPM